MRTTTPRLVFTLSVLLGINTMNFFDRQILPAVQEKVRRDWPLSDSDLGWLGTAFILLYAAVGLPLGRLADVWRRKWLLAGGVGLWSLLTFGSGLAWNFWSLFVLRLGVGVGEATCAPAASSLIGDLVPAQRRARAMALFMLGLPLGLALSSLVSGTIAQRYGWREAFFVAGLPGLLLAAAALFIADPRPQERTKDEGGRMKEDGRQSASSFILSGRGSAMNRAATASKSPGRPATKNASCQPRRWAMVPLTRKLSASPSGRPSMNTASARARRPAGTRSPISEPAAGAQVASPTPTPRRSTNSDQKFHARPEPSVSTLHRPTPAASSHLRRHTSASRPSGRPIAA